MSTNSTASTTSTAVSSTGAPRQQPRPERRSQRAKSLVPSIRPPLPPLPPVRLPIRDMEFAAPVNQPGTFSADGTFILEQPTSGPSRDKGPRKPNRRQRSQSRSIYNKPMPTGYFTADGQFMDGSPDESGVLPDGTIAPVHSRGRHDKPTSVSSFSANARPVSGKKHRGSNSGTTPAKEVAYAGPTFHASPDPSALPIPRFFSAAKSSLSKSDGEDSVPELPSSRNSPNDLQSPPDTPTPKLAHLQHEKFGDSPLDIFFGPKPNGGQNQSVSMTRDQGPNSQSSSPTPVTPASAAPSQRRIQSSNKRDFLNQLIGSVNTTTHAVAGSHPSAHNTPSATYATPARMSLDDQSSPFITHSAMHPVPYQFPPMPAGGHMPFPQSEPPVYRPFHYPTNPQPYHYGNANLSQLFKASVTPTRPGRAHSNGFQPQPRSHRPHHPSTDLRHIEEGMGQLSTGR